MTARVAKGMLKHFNQILSVWAGKECAHVKIIETIDDFGQIISQTQETSTITGIVGDANFKDNGFAIGTLAPGDLCCMFLYTDDVRLSDQLTDSTTRQDHIIFQGVEYRIISIDWGYDLNTTTGEHDPIFGKYLLRRTIT